MSGRLLFTDAARRQLRAAIESIRRADASAAQRLCEHVGALAQDRGGLEKRGTPLPEFPELPFREVRIDGFRVFFRRQQETTWIAGVWNVHKNPAPKLL